MTEEQAFKLGIEAYIYGYPLVLMDVSKALFTAVAAPEGLEAPINQFAHLKAFPDASFTSVVSPNADTFYSTAWLDLSLAESITNYELHLPHLPQCRSTEINVELAGDL